MKLKFKGTTDPHNPLRLIINNVYDGNVSTEYPDYYYLLDGKKEINYYPKTWFMAVE